MIKVVAILKRKKGLSFEQFRDHYETSHAMLAKKHFGHLFSDYRRNYLPSAPSITASDPAAAAAGSAAPDVVTEICFRDEKAFAEFGRLFGDPATQKIFTDDEERFLDRPACNWGIAEIVSG